VFGGEIFSELRVAWNRMSSSSLQPSFGTPANAQFGIKAFPTIRGNSGGIPHMNISPHDAARRTVLHGRVPESQVFQFSKT